MWNDLSRMAVQGFRPTCCWRTVGLLGLIVCGHACSDPPSVAQPTPLATGGHNIFIVTGRVHETAPTETVLLSGVRVTVASGALSGTTVVTDGNGSFVLPPTADGGFELAVTRDGYESRTVAIGTLPDDAHPDIALVPQFALIKEVFEGDLKPLCENFKQPLSQDFRFATHHEGPVTLQEYVWPTIGIEPAVIALFLGEPSYSYENRIWYSTCPLVCDTSPPIPAAKAAVQYVMLVELTDCSGSDFKSGKFRAVFTHPN